MNEKQPMYAVIDVGTNSIKLYIAKKNCANRWIPVLDQTEITRLGKGMQATGDLLPESMERTLSTLTRMRDLLLRMNVERVAVVGTMCLRTAGNAREFIGRLREACGFSLDVLSGKEEARLAYLGVVSAVDRPQGRLIMFDTGGGSTEFIIGEGLNIIKCLSLNVGAARYSEQFLFSDPVTRQEFDLAASAIAQDLSECCPSNHVERLIGIGGGVTTLSAVKHQLVEYSPERIEGSSLDVEELERQIALYLSKTLEERKQIVGLPPERAEVILAGAAIIREIMRKTGVSKITVSARGIRHGVLVDRF